MKNTVLKITDEVKSLEKHDFEEFLNWLYDYELSKMDDWDLKMEADSKEGGRLQHVIDRVHKDISENKVKPLDEILDNT